MKAWSHRRGERTQNADPVDQLWLAVKPLYILVRHLPSTEDEQRLFSDPGAEIPLLAIDRRRIGAVAACVAALRRDRDVPLVVLSSETQRSTTTVEAIAAQLPRATHRIDLRLHNIRHPEWNGLEQQAVRDSPLYQRWHRAPTTVSFPGGESLADVAARIDALLAELQFDTDHLIVSHSTPLQVLACRLLNIPLDAIWSFYFEFYAVTAILGGVLTRLNDASATSCDFSALYE